MSWIIWLGRNTLSLSSKVHGNLPSRVEILRPSFQVSSQILLHTSQIIQDMTTLPRPNAKLSFLYKETMTLSLNRLTKARLLLLWIESTISPRQRGNCRTPGTTSPLIMTQQMNSPRKSFWLFIPCMKMVISLRRIWTLIVDRPRARRFYLLPKIHKTGNPSLC